MQQQRVYPMGALVFSLLTAWFMFAAHPAMAQDAGARAVANVGALTMLVSPTDGATANVAGFYDADDSGGGEFRYDSDSAEAHDGGRAIAPGAPDPSKDLAAYLEFKPAARRGRWVRITEPGRVSVKWYGARGDGKADDSPAMLKACAQFHARKVRGTVFIPRGTYHVPQFIQLHANVDIVGEGIGCTVIERRNDDNYLLRTSGGTLNATISHLTFDNPQRLLLGRGVSRLSFEGVEFLSGMVRFETCQYIRINNCVFRNNIGKAAYASSNCSYVTITGNTIRNTVYGGINLSGHDHCIVANNIIVKDAIVPDVPGYGGIRLPNTAQYNTVTGNVVQNFPRGIFVLSGSSYNTIAGNVVDGAAGQGVLVQSDRNTIAQNVVRNSGAEGIRLDHANGCIVTANQISSTQPSQPALSLTSASADNQVFANLIDAPFPMSIGPTEQPLNTVSNNVTVAPPRPVVQPTTQQAD